MCERPAASISASGKSLRSKLSSKLPFLPPLAVEREEKTPHGLSIGAHRMESEEPSADAARL